MRILVVENSRRMQEAMRVALGPFGGVTIAASADEARAEFERSGPFDIVFTDYHMRGGSGLEVVDYVNRNHADTPVVVITAYGTKELTIECLNRQVFTFLEKPVQYEQIKEVMSKAASKRSRTLAEKRIKDLGVLSNLIFHEIGGSLQDLLNETQSIDPASVASDLPEELGERFQQLHDNIHRTTHAFRNLKFLVSEDRQPEQALEEVDLQDLMRRLSSWIEPWTGSGIRAEFGIPEDTIRIHGLTGLIERAAKNILINAIESLGDSGRIQVTLDSAPGETLLRIANDGPSISPEDMERIFEFSYSTKDSAHSLPRGIGLYVVDRVMKRVGGQVRVSSDPNLTEFALVFPSPR